VSIPDDEITLLARKFHTLHRFHKERRRRSSTDPSRRRSIPPTSTTTTTGKTLETRVRARRRSSRG
jgi:hypothetical protein